MMRKLALAAIFVGASALAACGGGGDDDVSVLPDANPNLPDAGAACNPVTQSGCDAGQKCTWITVSDVEGMELGKTGCVAEGAVALDGACAAGEPGLDTGFDDCAKGLYCRSAVCTEICTGTPDSCGDTKICVLYSNTFDDLGEDSTVGLCNATCEPTAQLDAAGAPDAAYTDCPDGQGCFLSPAKGKASCASIPPGAAGKKQNDLCYGPLGTDNCYLNGCDVGYQSILFQMPGGPKSVCGAFCTPENVALGVAGDAQGTAPTDCAPARISGDVNQGCRFIQNIYNSAQFDGTIIPATLGLCTDETTWGNCEEFDPAGQITTYNTAYTAAAGDEMAKAAAGGLALCLSCGLDMACCNDDTGAACEGQDLGPNCQDVGCIDIASSEAYDAMYLGASLARPMLNKIREIGRNKIEREFGGQLVPPASVDLQ